MLQDMNCGQKCLLRGLHRAVCHRDDDVYGKAAAKSSEVSRSESLKDKLGKLFNRSEAGPSSSHQPLRKRPGKGKGPMKGPVKKKVKKCRLKVVGMKTMVPSVPVGIERESQMKTVWIRDKSSAQELADKIRESFGWSKLWSLQYMYSCGRHLRPATLDDVENAEEWDVETVRVLMGNGCLYVCRYAALENEDVENKDLSDKEVNEENDEISVEKKV